MMPISVVTHEVVVPSTETWWLRPTSYWQPAHIVTSAWLQHAPFAAWLVDVVRPRRLIELGTHYGFSFFTFAEAFRRLGLEGEILALDTWAGDEQAGFYGEDVFDSVRTVAESEYGGFTRLLRGYFSESRPLVEDHTTDLLHIDGRHGYDDVKEDFLQWVDTVRPGGAILFHDIAERDRGFGVWRLWNELSDTYPSFAFEHGHGLGVIGIGDGFAPELRQLFEAGDETRARIRSDYEALGAVVERQAALEAMPAEIDSLHDAVGSLQDLIGSLRRDVESLRSTVHHRDREIEGYRTSTSWKVTRPLRALGRVIHRPGR
jgi:Methyltransferase domain